MVIDNLNVNWKKAASTLKHTFTVVSAGVVMMTFSGCGYKDYVEEMNNSSYSYGEDVTDIDLLRAAISDDNIQELPSSITSFSLKHCTFVTSLDSLPSTCPDIETLELDSCSGITDLSFIYSLKNLKSVKLNDMAGITPELIDYLKSNGISYEISDDDLTASLKVDEILDEIINDDMSDDEKIRAIVVYVNKNCKYRFSKVTESNTDPLSTSLNENKGVCYGIAYTTNVLLRKAGIKSYQLSDTDHAWNLVEDDGKYYYIDVTNLGGGRNLCFIARPLVKYTGFSPNYMVDPTATSFTAMSDFDDREHVIIPQSLVEDIEKGEDEKTILERYGTSIPIRVIELVITMVGIHLGIKMAKNAVENIRYRRSK